jgi:APA family basic amino acid/polyamine antiporter
MTKDVKLPRSLNKLDATMLIVGNMIGIGIFTTTGFISGYISSPAALFVVWIMGAFYSYCGALTYAELSSRFPVSGGDYHFLKKAYHPLLGFLFGWSTFTVTYTGSVATIAVGFATYALNFFPEIFQKWTVPVPFFSANFTSLKLIAIIITVIVTGINVRGVRRGAVFQNIIAISGVAVILMFVFLGFSKGQGNSGNFQPFFPDNIFAEIPALFVAMASIVFTYAGWTTIVYIAGEIKDPSKNIPAAMWISVTLVGFIYLLINVVYLYALPLSGMNDVVDIGFQSMQVLFNRDVGLLFAAIIVLLTLSSLNSTILSGARIYYAMAEEDRFFRFVGKLHPRFKVPAASLWVQCTWSIVLILSGTFNQLLTYTVFIIVLFSLLSGVALFILRRRQPPQDSIYLMKGYPVLPAVYVLFSAFITISILIHRPLESLIGIFIVSLGTPFFLFWEKRIKKLST